MTLVPVLAAMMSSTFARCQHTLRVALGDEPVWVSGDPTRLKQIFSNLLQNAAAYTPGDGMVHVTMTVEGNLAIVRLRDNGIGISSDALERIFELFERGEQDAHSPSVGIGLALVRRLVELHGGSVTALSDGLGRGSEFVVSLPIADK